jgi:hypothetical protein
MRALHLLLACGTETPETTELPTYWKDVRPVLDQSCARCHTDGGQATSFDSAEAVVALAGAIKESTASRRMPPPAPDPACADYVGADALFLSDASRATLAAWADAGAPLGDAADAPAPWTPVTLAPFDVVMQGDAPYQPRFAEDGNDYRCFELEVGNETRTWVEGFEPLVDNDGIVHHIVLWSLPDDAVTPVSDDGMPGFACDGFGEGGWDFFAGWAPGGQPVRLPAGVGMPIPARARFVLQMHYFDAWPGADQEWDQSGYAMLLADSVQREAYAYPLGVEGFRIRPNDPAHEEAMVFPWPDRYGTFTILGTFPHMHLRGASFDLRLRHAGAPDTCIAHLDDWDFHNQQSVLLRTPVTVAPGDIVDLRCVYDNGGNDAWVEWGERTDQEMCYAFTYLYEGDPLP